MRARKKVTAAANKGFTLIEMLVVVSIFVVLLTAVVPAISSTIRASRVSMAVHLVVDEINAAQAAAVAQNKPMEICFLRGKEGTPDFFEQMATRSLEQDGTKKWANRNRKLPDGVCISANNVLSTLIGSQTEATNLRGEKEVCLLLTPSGEMVLPAVSGTAPTEFYLTVASLSDLQRTPSVFPANFATIRIDPRNSQTTVHRP